MMNEKSFLIRHRRVMLALLAVPVLFGLAWFYRYEAIGMSGTVWDRWTHRECNIQSLEWGYGCNFDNAKAENERQEHAARDALEEKSTAATPRIVKFTTDLSDRSGTSMVRTYRAAGFTEKEISEWADELRGKLLAAGAPKNLVDDYFGGDPYLR
jgi:hypothetical protein